MLPEPMVSRLDSAIRRLEAQRAILLRVGDAGALSVELNGRVLPPLGGDGQVVERRFTAPAQ